MMLAFCSAALACMLVGASSPRTDDALKARFLSEAPEGWKKLHAAEGNIEGVLRIESWDRHGDADPIQVFNRLVTFGRKGASVSLETKSMEGGGGTSVIASNDRYTFRIAKLKNNATFALKALVLAPPADTLAEVQSSTYFWRALQARREFWTIPLEEMIADKSFRIKAIEEVPGGASRLVRVDFSYSAPKRDINWADAWMVLDPSDSWAIQGAGHNTGRGGHVVITIDRPEQVPAGGRFRYLRVARYPESGFEQTYQFTFEQLDRRVLPDSDFRLSRYGFPEPDQPVKRGGGTLHFWVIGTGLFLLAMAFALRWRFNAVGA